MQGLFRRQCAHARCRSQLALTGSLGQRPVRAHGRSYPSLLTFCDLISTYAIICVVWGGEEPCRDRALSRCLMQPSVAGARRRSWEGSHRQRYGCRRAPGFRRRVIPSRCSHSPQSRLASKTDLSAQKQWTPLGQNGVLCTMGIERQKWCIPDRAPPFPRIPPDVLA